jgi:hypothetical protein
MAVLMITCPVASRKVSTGIRMNGRNWNSGPKFYAYTRCPACGGYPEWSAKDVTLDAQVESPELTAIIPSDGRRACAM